MKRHSVKYENKSKSVKRFCIGKICRGQKEFNSINGHRLCRSCREAIFDDVEDYEVLRVTKKSAM